MVFNYNFYERKDELTSRDQLDWIAENIERIYSEEDVLFTFQAEHVALLFTDLGIYFPNRIAKRLIAFRKL